jgi:hypothetical protein
MCHLNQREELNHCGTIRKREYAPALTTGDRRVNRKP